MGLARKLWEVMRIINAFKNFFQKIIVVLEFWCLWSRRRADDSKSCWETIIQGDKNVSVHLTFVL
jgi:hypothetical protein